MKEHPTNGAIVITMARKGFECYQGHQELLNTLRMHLQSDQNPTWKDFKIVVDKFLGDSVRYTFNTAILDNQNGIAAMDISGINKTTSPPMVGNLDFKPVAKFVETKGKPAKVEMETLVPKDNKPLQSAIKRTSVVSNAKSVTSFKSNNSNVNKNKGKNNNKPKTFVCGWCNGPHNSWNCKTQGNGKWKDKICQHCKGTGHPKSVCPSAPKKN